MTQTQQHSPKYLRRRKSLLVLPLLVAPFLLLLFYALGGGKGESMDTSRGNAGKGFNLNLPKAQFARKEKEKDKLGIYQQAEADSVKLREQIKQDPYHTLPVASAPIKGSPFNQPYKISSVEGGLNLLPGSSPLPQEDPDADKLLKKLEQLKQSIQQPVPSPGNPIPEPPASLPATHTSYAPDMSRLQKLLQSAQTADTSKTDPQLDRLNGMLDKIIKIQHPDPAPAEPTETSPLERTNALPVKTAAEAAAVSDGMGTNPPEGADSLPDAGGFYSIGEDAAGDPGIPNTIPAVVQQDQALVSGETICLRLTEEASVNGIALPRDNLVYGQVSLTNDRMLVTIRSIRTDRAIYPVALEAYDLDGLPGIHIKGSLIREAGRESADQTISSIGLSGLNPSLGAQAATAGIQAARNLLSKKVKQSPVSVPAGYQILLRNTSPTRR